MKIVAVVTDKLIDLRKEDGTFHVFKFQIIMID